MELEEAIEKTKELLNLNDLLFEETGTHLYLGNQEKELIQILLNHITKREKMIQKIHENFCKFDWKNSNGEEVHNQLKELYESIFKNEESE